MRIEMLRWFGVSPPAQLKEDLETLSAAALDCGTVTMEARRTTVVREHVRKELMNRGWSDEARISPHCDLTVFSKSLNSAFQIQLGNISRAAYDLLKLQHLYSSRQIQAAILALPMKETALSLGSNVANYERIATELALFKETITLPLLLVGVE